MEPCAPPRDWMASSCSAHARHTLWQPSFSVISPLMVVRLKVSVYIKLEERLRANKVAVSWHAQSILEIGQEGTGCGHCTPYAHVCAQLQAFAIRSTNASGRDPCVNICNKPFERRCSSHSWQKSRQIILTLTCNNAVTPAPFLYFPLATSTSLQGAGPGP